MSDDLVERLQRISDRWGGGPVHPEVTEAVAEIERLRTRINGFERLSGFFAPTSAGAPPTPQQVFDRMVESWQAGETVPIEAITFAACIKEWRELR